MLVSTEIYIAPLDIEIMVSCDMWATVSRVKMDYVYMDEVDGDVGPLSWDQSEYPGFNEEIACWLDDNYDTVEKKLWDEYYNECDALNEAYQLRNI